MRVCIIRTTERNAPILKAHLPPGVTVRQERGGFDVWGVELQLTGDRLPSWCEVREGHYVSRAVAELLDDGRMRFVPGDGLPLKQIPESITQPDGSPFPGEYTWAGITLNWATAILPALTWS